MAKIDTTQWKEFYVKELFETIKNGKQVPTGANIPIVELTEDGNIPRISVTGINNGVLGYFDYKGKSQNYRIYNNFISVSFLGTVFYHSGDATLDMKVHCLKPRHIKLNKYTGAFLVTAIKSSLRQSSYADQISSSLLPNMKLFLPVNSAGEPDWSYMDNYMKEVEKKVQEQMQGLKNLC